MRPKAGTVIDYTTKRLGYHERIDTWVRVCPVCGRRGSRYDLTETTIVHAEQVLDPGSETIGSTVEIVDYCTAAR